MSNSLEFIEKAITEPDFLKLGDSVNIKLAVTYLSRYGHDKNMNFLKKVVGQLCNTWNEQQSHSISQSASNDFFFDNIKKLLEPDKLTDLDLSTETLNMLMEFYRNNSSVERPLYKLLDFILSSIEGQTNYLLIEEMQAYFYGDVTQQSMEKQMIYCLHVINGGYLYYMERNKFDLKPANANKIKSNLIKLIYSRDENIRRFSIWAFHWLTGGSTKIQSLVPISTEESEHLYSMLSNNNDRSTTNRICYMLIKRDEAVYNLIKQGQQSAREWLRSLTQLKANSPVDRKIKFRYSERIEKNLAEFLDEKDETWLNLLIVPYLGTMSSETVTETLIANLMTGNETRVRITSAVILNGLGLLTEKLIQMYNLNSREFTDEVNKKYTRSSAHLIHKLKAKDTTGRWAYYFILVEPEREDAFLKAIEGDGTIDIEDYGKVVASCYGEKPTQEVKDYLKEKYGFDV